MNSNITVLCNCRFPSKAAHGVYLAKLCESFSASGAKVELVVPQRYKEEKVDPLKYYGVKSSFAVRKIRSFDFLIFGRLLGRLAFPLQYSAFYVFVVFFFLFRSRKRIIYTMDNLGCLLTFLGYKVIFETHIGIGNYRAKLLPLIKKASKLIVLNSKIKKDFEEKGFRSEKILVAPNGVSLELFSGKESKHELRKLLGLPEDLKIIAYVGRYKTMGEDKGVLGIAHAFSYLISSGKSCFLLIVGLEDREIKELEGKFQDFSLLSNQYKLVGHVTQVEVAFFLKASDILAMNYPNTEYYANYMSPMKMFEYMASGNPIITSDLPSVREVLDDSSALFVLPDNDGSFRAGLEKLLGDEAMAKRLSASAQEKVQNFTWEKRAKRILEFMGSI